MILALDTETCGLDLYHLDRPYLVTLCYGDGEQQFYEWTVDPLTREVQAPQEDLDEIAELLNPYNNPKEIDCVVGQNIKYDITALSTLRPEFGQDWLWELTHDTLIAGHLLHSSMPHDLTSMALHYLGVDIQPYEDRLEEAVKQCRRMVQQARLKLKRGKEAEDIASWRIAEEGLEGMPSVKGEAWKLDAWLPRVMVRRLWETSEAGMSWLVATDHGISSAKWEQIATRPGWDYRPPEIKQGNHPWWTVLRDYANADSGATVELWKVQEAEIRRRGLWDIYRERMKVVSVAYKMEQRGVTVSRGQLEHLEQTYREDSKRLGEICTNLAASYKVPCECLKEDGNRGCGLCNYTGEAPYSLILPKNGINASLRTFCFDVLKLPPQYSKKAKTAAPTLDKVAMDFYEQTLPPRGKQLAFIKALLGKRKKDTSLSFIESYRKFWLPLNLKCEEPGEPTDWYLLHPSLNVTGADTLRWSCSNPNAQQISKLPDEQGHTLRFCFGPAPGREWWSMDYENIELRIPAYESGEPAMVDLFERPDDPPFYGSYHLLNASLVYPDLFWEPCCPKCLGKGCKEGPCEPKKPLGEIKGGFKDKYKSSWYQWIKNAGFALVYGCQREKFDATAHKAGAYDLLRGKLRKLFQLGDYWIAYADKHGYVETVPDKTVNPKRGYPVVCSRSEWGKILPTVPLNYHVQSTACWAAMKALIRCQDQLDQWRDRDGFDGYLVLYVHDEIVLDFPKGDSADPQKPSEDNLRRAKIIRGLMEMSGDDIGIPLKSSLGYHPSNWGEEVKV